MLALRLLLSLRQVASSLTETRPPPFPKAGVRGFVAGPRYVPFHIRAAFWQRFRLAA